MKRPLGSAEHFTWLYDRVSPIHFCLTARIAGKFQVEQLTQALDWVQQRHPLLRVKIVADEQGQPFLEESAPKIPLQVISRQRSTHWQEIVEKEILNPFIASEAPLVRVILVHSPEISEIIATFHHSIADGLSASYFLRDLLQQMTNPQIKAESLPLRPAFEDLLPIIKNSQADTSVNSSKQDNNTPNNDSLSKYRYPQLISGSIAPQETHLLLSRCRQEQTTVHGAICAAFLLAIAEIQASSPVLTCASPVNLRKWLNPIIDDEIGYYFTLNLTTHNLAQEKTFWEIARSVKSQLHPNLIKEQLCTKILQRKALLSTFPSPELIRQSFVSGFSYDVLVTNLGCLAIPQDYGHLKLQAIFGPVAMTGMPQEWFIGVATLGDELFFTILSAYVGMLPNKLQQIAIHYLKMALEK